MQKRAIRDEVTPHLRTCGSHWLSKVSSTIRLFGDPELKWPARLEPFWKRLTDELPQGAQVNRISRRTCATVLRREVAMILL